MPAPARAGDPLPNFLLLLADDLGIDRVGAYGAHPDPGNTPVIDQLAADGMLFRNAWANSFCSATRAALLTGRHGFRTGIGTFVKNGPTASELPLDELTLPQVLAPTHRNAVVGKWHLSANPSHPQAVGFESHRGSRSNLPGSDSLAYFAWDKNIDGVIVPSTTYATTDTVDEALAFIASFSAAPEPEPWFLWVAFNAPHKPFHAPPAGLHSMTLPSQVGPGDEPLFMQAMAEAMDTEIGRPLAGIDPAVLAGTIVIFVGDNGTDGTATTAPFLPGHAKSTVFDGGVHVPLIVKGPGVLAGAECDGLVGATDLFATLTELAGVAVADPADSLGFAPYLAAPTMPSLRS
ncbi:MAG: arylsulfatase B [Pseudohongiellaceae bacterium]|jgi:arylsulfatase B